MVTKILKWSTGLLGTMMVIGGGCLPDNYWVGLAGDVTTQVVTTPITTFLGSTLSTFLGLV